MYKSCKEILDRLENEGVRVNHGFEFPEPIPLEKKLKDVLEKEVDERYYLSDDKAKTLKFSDVSKTVRSGGRSSLDRHSWDIVKVGDLGIKGQDQIRRVYDSDGISPTLSTMQGGNRQPKIIDPQGRKNKVCVPRDFAPTLRAQTHGNVPVVIDDTYGYNDKPREYEGISPTLRSGRQGLKVVEPYRIRKLTPKECYRLMGFDDESFDKTSKVISNTQLYKTAGNSIVVDVLMAIFKELFSGS